MGVWIWYVNTTLSVDLQLIVQSVPVTTKVVSSNPAHGEVYSIQHYVIKFVSDLCFSMNTPVSSSNKTDHHDITEILLKVALNTTITQSPNTFCKLYMFLHFSMF
jgi:hypothetical protein